MMKIMFDTREQEPLLFKEYIEVNKVREKLDCGDYTISGYDLPGDDDSIIIERKKNCNEYLRNLGANFDTFTNELCLMTKYKHKMILVCGPDNFDYLYEKGLTLMNPNFVYKQIALIQIKYGISTVFCGTRDKAEHFMYRLFNEVVKRHQ